MKYEFAPDLQIIAEEISFLLFPHIQMERVKCLRGYGTSSSRTIARCHALGKLMQKAIGIKPFYALEFLSERFDNLDPKEQIPPDSLGLDLLKKNNQNNLNFLKQFFK